jgi:UDP-N-acetylglucosamine/UDP-N-acetylgalactosamine diphosphorylase
MAPPGSGELLPELRRSGALAALARSGVRHVEVNAIDDNLLWRPADPVFLGFAAASRADAAAKVVEPEAVLEAYAGLDAGFPDGAEAGELLDAAALQAPAMGAYYFALPALERLAAAYAKEPLAGLRLVPARGIPKRGAAPALPALPPNLPPQARAQALAAAARAAEAAAAPRPVDGYALQRYLADALRFGDLLEPGKTALLGCVRDEEFATAWGRGPHWAVSPPEGASARMLGLHTAWVEAAGGEVAAEEGVEVSPLVSYAGEGLHAVAEGAVFEEPFDAALQAAPGGGGGAGGGGSPHNAGPWVVPLALAYGGGLALALAKSVAKAAGKGK